jgi:hypothetical protein
MIVIFKLMPVAPELVHSWTLSRWSIRARLHAINTKENILVSLIPRAMNKKPLVIRCRPSFDSTMMAVALRRAKHFWAGGFDMRMGWSSPSSAEFPQPPTGRNVVHFKFPNLFFRVDKYSRPTSVQSQTPTEFAQEAVGIHWYKRSALFRHAKGPWANIGRVTST